MGINVLSLFDGISCGQLALKQAGIEVDNYFASEIDKHAITVTQNNFPKTIQLGDVTKISAKELPKIDLLIGGSPCQGFSYAGKMLNFNDPRSKLFFDYVRIKKEIQPKHFLLENVKTKKIFQDVITDQIGVEPILINSSLVSKQTRSRLYWTNIKFNRNIENKRLCFDKYLYQLPHGGCKEKIKFFRKYPCLLAGTPSATYRLIVDFELAKSVPFSQLKKYNNISRCLTPEECEELQTIPYKYTDYAPKTHRYRLIGNSWTVEIVSHIFKGLLKNFLTT